MRIHLHVWKYLDLSLERNVIGETALLKSRKNRVACVSLLLSEIAVVLVLKKWIFFTTKAISSFLKSKWSKSGSILPKVSTWRHDGNLCSNSWSFLLRDAGRVPCRRTRGIKQVLIFRIATPFKIFKVKTVSIDWVFVNLSSLFHVTPSQGLCIFSISINCRSSSPEGNDNSVPKLTVVTGAIYQIGWLNNSKEEEKRKEKIPCGGLVFSDFQQQNHYPAGTTI